ncbi:MAG: hypothetical protein M3R53_00300 [Candidatus Eremiobacteraeota bacterium]|nr:hypothetical protein [Candidatus Eremiobacteraeota bacterium]
MSDKILPGRPKADDEMQNATAGDDAMQDDLTEERQVTPRAKEDVAETQTMDP